MTLALFVTKVRIAAVKILTPKEGTAIKRVNTFLGRSRVQSVRLEPFEHLFPVSAIQAAML